MPELPEVETICRGLASTILGYKIVAVTIRNAKLRYPIPKKLTEILPEKQFLKITHRGKYILLKTDLGTLIVHLGMSGTLQTKSKNLNLLKHDHFIINFTNDLSLRYNDPRRFGAILWTDQNPLKHPLLKKLGPEPFAKNFTANYLFQQAKSRKTSIKQFIMDNKVVTGIGNIYANEILFAAKINPLQKTNTISLEKHQKLQKETKKILTLAIKHRGTTIKDHTDSSGKAGSFQKKLKVYGKENQPCCKCKSKLKVTTLGQRTTIFCPQCQST